MIDEKKVIMDNNEKMSDKMLNDVMIIMKKEVYENGRNIKN
jgi:hypothetical protein